MRRLFFMAYTIIGTISSLMAQSKLDGYIQAGLNDNESIKQQQFYLQKSLYALKEAKSLFMPNISLGTTYTLATGGRAVDLPVGDLMNPVYKTLNTLTKTNAFPTIENASIPLNPNNFYDAKIHTTFPIINAEIWYNRKIKLQMFDLQKTEVDIYKRELVKEIKLAYFKCQQASNAVRIYENAKKLVAENLRINTSLFNNQKVNRTAVVRSENELSKISSQWETAKENEQNAHAYLNFLLNRPVSTKLELDSIQTAPEMSILSDTAIAKREELTKLNTAKSINSNMVGLANSYLIPKLSSFVDVGSQGYNFSVNDKTAYAFLGISLEWNLFAGGKNIDKVKQAQLEQSATSSQINYVEQQLKLQLTVCQNNFQSSISQYKAAQTQLVSSQKYYDDFLHLYKEGQAMYIELLDAQNQLIAAQNQKNISLYDTWIKHAELERANASFNIK